MTQHVTLSSRVRLARNFADIPFDAAHHETLAATCVTRTQEAISRGGMAEEYDLLRLRDMTDNERKAMAESRLISLDLMKTPETAAVFVKEMEGISIMVNEEDHLRIQAICQGIALDDAAEKCFRIEDVLSRSVSFAFDDQWGYLTALPTNTGTGMRASLLMHLPMITSCKQMGNVGQIVAKVGLTIRGVYGEGNEALGDLYQVSNQVTLGRSEQDLIGTVTAVGRQLTDMEVTLREKAYLEKRSELEDRIYRAWGLMKYARSMSLKEFYRHFSSIRLGVDMGLLSVTPELLDMMLEHVQPAHLDAYSGRTMEEKEADIMRSARIRKLLTPYHA